MYRRILYCLLACILLFPSCAGKKAEITKESESVKSETVSSAETSDDSYVEALGCPETLAEKFSYVYGYQQTANLLSNYDLNPEYIAKGVLDGANGNGYFTFSEMQSILTEYLSELQADSDAQLQAVREKNLDAAEQFLSVNGTRNTVKTTASGLQYEMLKEGNGKAPTEKSTVLVQYQLVLLSGEVVDSSYTRGEASRLNLASSLVPGFKEAVLLLKEGGKVRAWLHPTLGYGVNGSTKVAPNELLIFDIELVSVEQ
jgi:FKBP-type peptidyl-prolyl cis-trans isomerases 1